MADIAGAVSYTKEQQKFIGERLKDQSFTYLSWKEDEMAPFRSAVREHYRREQFGLCAYCRGSISLVSALNAHVEHIAPKSKYREFIFEPKNLCVICADCSAIKQSQEVLEAPDPVKRKVSRYPRSSSAFLIVHPHFDRWDDHILKAHGFYVDRTPKGHFTIGACVLNRKIREFGWEATLTEDAAAAVAVKDLIDGATPGDRAVALTALLQALLPNQAGLRKNGSS